MPKVGELVLVAAPSYCGKTRFLEQLYSGRLNELAATMNIIVPVSSYVSVIPKQLATLGDQHVSRLILHFAIPTIALNDGSAQDIADDPRLKIVPSSDRVTVITLLASAGVLAQRLELRSKANRKLLYRNFPKYVSERRRFGKLRHLYAKPDSVIVAYDAWFRYSKSLSNLAGEWLVIADNDYQVVAAKEWQRIRSSYSVGSLRVDESS